MSLELKKITTKVIDFFSGKEVEEMVLDSEVFDAEWSDVLFKEVYDYYRDNQRNCTYSTKKFETIAGSGKKQRPQKGLGRARVHTYKAPQFRGGVVAFGPNGRDFFYNIPKKKKQKVLCMVLTRMFKEGKLKVVQELKGISSKTKEFLKIMSTLNMENALMVSKVVDQKLMLSQRNVQFFDLLNVDRVGIMNILKYKNLIVDKEALLCLEKRGGNDGN